MNSLFTYFRNVRAEMKHVVWPSNKQAMTHVALIIGISVFTALIIAGLDYGFTNAVSFLINR
jgi:preprotein translocase subunit SecE